MITYLGIPVTLAAMLKTPLRDHRFNPLFVQDYAEMVIAKTNNGDEVVVLPAALAGDAGEIAVAIQKLRGK